MRRLTVLSFLLILLAAPVRGEDRLTIGISQFPANLQPNIESMLAKTYVLGMTRRPITAYDHDWQLICMLCTELPTIENGLAVPETAGRTADRESR